MESVLPGNVPRMTSPLEKTLPSILWVTSALPPPAGGSGADPGEAGAASRRPAEAGGDQGVLVRPGEHHQGQGPPALREQEARAGGEELLGPRPPAVPPGAAAPPAGAGAPPAHLQRAAAEVPGQSPQVISGNHPHATPLVEPRASRDYRFTCVCVEVVQHVVPRAALGVGFVSGAYLNVYLETSPLLAKTF